MGLNDNTKNIYIALSEKNKIEKQKQLEKARKEAERKRKIEEKENYKRLEEEIKGLLIGEFQKYFNICGSSYSIEFYNIHRKTEILNDCINNLGNYKKQIWNNGETTEICTNKKEIIEIFNKYYYKILKEQAKIYELNDKYKYYKMLEEAEQNNNNSDKEYSKINILEFFKIILYIIFLPIVFIFMLVFAVCKNSK